MSIGKDWVMVRIGRLGQLILAAAIGLALSPTAYGWATIVDLVGEITPTVEKARLWEILPSLWKEFGGSAKFEWLLRQKALAGGIATADSDRSAECLAARTVERHGVTVEGFDQIPGFSDAALRGLLSEQYPSGFLRALEVRIRYVAHAWPDRAADICDMGYIQITIFNDPAENQLAMTRERAPWLIQHELGHASDWNYSRTRAWSDRLQMLAEATDRFNATDHFRGYHELRQIVYDPDNPQNDKYQAVGEYWADLVREYVRNPARLRNEFPQDYELAQKWFLHRYDDMGGQSPETKCATVGRRAYEPL